jgi:hypothetical protein
MLVSKPKSLPPEETAMDPTTTYYLAQARTAEWRRQAQLDALVRAARRERRSRRQSSSHPAPARPTFGRRVLTTLGVRAA